MKKICLLFSMLSAIALIAADVELKLWPHNPREAAQWPLSPGSSWERGKDGSYTLVVTSKSPQEGILNTRNLDLKKYVGYGVEATCWIKGENISKPSPSFLGTKFMMPHQVNGVTTWLSATDGLHGTYDWRKFSLSMMVVPGMENASIQLGLQAASGTVRFRDLQVKLIPPEKVTELPYELPKNFRCSYSEAIEKRPVMRGAMTCDPRWINMEDIKVLASWGGNLIRWQFHPSKSVDPEQYRKDLDASLDKLISLAPEFQKLGIMIVFDMHAPPGGRFSEPTVLGTAGKLAQLDGSSCMRIFQDKFYFDHFVAMWKHIASRLKDIPVIWGYDLLNEPSNGGQKPVFNYLATQYAAAAAIREIDPETPIIVEADEWANPNGFGYLLPLPLKNVFYSFHFYMPGEYTHQGTQASQLKAIREGKMLKYPGEISGVFVDKKVLRGAMEPIVSFQKKYGAKIFCGEFSVIRWAPGADQWLEDVLSLFEEQDWSYTYHAFREWDGWSVEHDENCDNPHRVNYTTKRKQLLLDVFKKNQPVIFP